MQILESIIHEAKAVSDMANSEPSPDLASAVVNLADLVAALAQHIKDNESKARRCQRGKLLSQWH